MPERAELVAAVLGLLAHRAPAFAGMLGEETPLADGGLCLDSLAIMDFVGELETRFGVTVGEADLSVEQFGTVERVVRFLETKLSAGPLRS